MVLMTENKERGSQQTFCLPRLEPGLFGTICFCLLLLPCFLVNIHAHCAVAICLAVSSHRLCGSKALVGPVSLAVPGCRLFLLHDTCFGLCPELSEPASLQGMHPLAFTAAWRSFPQGHQQNSAGIMGCICKSESFSREVALKCSPAVPL